jgi:hypothetical protein
LSIEQKVENIKQRISMLTEMIKIGEEEIKTPKLKDNYMAQKYKELNDAYAEIKKYDPDYRNS